MENVVPIIDDKACQYLVAGVGAEQGFQGIAIRVGARTIELSNGVAYNGKTICTAWRPNAEELARLNAGAAFYIEQNTAVVSPIVVTVGPEPEPATDDEDQFDFRAML